MATTTLISTEERREILMLALASWRGGQVDTLRQLSLLENPAGMHYLLSVASSEPALISQAVKLMDESPADILSATVRYIETLCLSSTDPYLLLGLQHGASTHGLKQHYRLMMRLFHPDRTTLPTARAAPYAAKINQAYTQLVKDVSTPKAMDSLILPAGGHLGLQYNPDGRRSILSKAPVQWILGLLVLAGIFTYLQINYSRPTVFVADATPAPKSIVTAEPPGIVVYQAPPLDLNPPLQQPQARFDSGTQQGYAPQSLPRIALSTPALVSKPHPKLLRSDELPALKPTRYAPYQTSVDAPEISSSSGATASEPVKTNTQPVPQVVSLSESQLRAMIIRLVDSYNKGDLDRFMGLMNDNLKATDAKDKEEMRMAYGSLFALSEGREMILKDLHWQINGSKAVGLMDYRANVKANGAGVYNAQVGSLKLEVVLVNQNPQIIGFYTATGTH